MTHCVVVIPYPGFRTTYWYPSSRVKDFWPMKFCRTTACCVVTEKRANCVLRRSGCLKSRRQVTEANLMPHMRVAWSITKVTKTHAEYVKKNRLIDSHTLLQEVNDFIPVFPIHFDRFAWNLVMDDRHVTPLGGSGFCEYQQSERSILLTNVTILCPPPQPCILQFSVGRDSSVGIATRYGQGIESRWGARFSAPVQTGPGAHPASYTRSFPGVKLLGRGVDHPPQSSAEVKERVELYIRSLSGPSWPVLRWPLPLSFYSTVFNRFCKNSVEATSTKIGWWAAKFEAMAGNLNFGS